MKRCGHEIACKHSHRLLRQLSGRHLTQLCIRAHDPGMPTAVAPRCDPYDVAINADPFENPDQFDVSREVRGHIAFGFGLHFCLGAALARLEGRIAVEEVLKRFPEWTVDVSRARLSPTSTVRGWDTLPVSIP